jgi:hypothetical protein
VSVQHETAISQFQASSSRQGRRFAEQCDDLLRSYGFQLSDRVVLAQIGVEIDQEAISPLGTKVWFEYKGSIQGSRPGLRRTDTVKKAVANGALLQAIETHPPFIVLASHLPESGSALAMITQAKILGYISDVICVYDPAQLEKLKQL